MRVLMIVAIIATITILGAFKPAMQLNPPITVDWLLVAEGDASWT
jgi:hypothetical protein